MHLSNFIDRLSLEIFLINEFKREILFIFYFGLLITIGVYENANDSMFLIQSNLQSVLRTEKAASVYSMDAIYDYLENQFIPGIQSITLTSPASLGQVPTFVLQYPIIYRIQGRRSECNDTFSALFQISFASYIYCSVKLWPIPSSVGPCPELAGLVKTLQCPDNSKPDESEKVYNLSTGDQVRFRRIIDRSYGETNASVLLSPQIGLISELKNLQWIDQYTVRSVIKGIFYTPTKNIYSFLSIAFDSTQNNMLTPSVEISSYFDTSDSKTWKFLTFSCGIIIFSQIIVDLIGIRNLKMKRFLGKGMKYNSLIEFIFRIFIDLGCFIFILIKLGFYYGKTESISILTQKMFHMEIHNNEQCYLDTIFALFECGVYFIRMRFVLVLLLVFLSLRFILLLSNHPRVSMLAETLRIGSDDFLHFLIIFFSLFVLFTFMGYWAFGSELQSFSSIPITMQTQFQSLTGNWPFTELQTASSQLSVALYVFLFGLFMYFIILNFFLAIVVDSFEICKQKIEEYKVENSLILDIRNICKVIWYRWRHEWPNHIDVLNGLLELQQDGNRRFVSINELKGVLTGNGGGLENFWKFYEEHYGLDETGFLNDNFGSKFDQTKKAQLSEAIADISDTIKEIGTQLDERVVSEGEEGSELIQMRSTSLLSRENTGFVNNQLYQTKLEQVDEILELLNQQKDLIDRRFFESETFARGPSVPSSTVLQDSVEEPTQNASSPLPVSSERIPKKTTLNGLTAPLNQFGYENICDPRELSIFAQRYFKEFRNISINSDMKLYLFSFCEDFMSKKSETEFEKFISQIEELVSLQD
jgi:Polycystin cation channel